MLEAHHYLILEILHYLHSFRRQLQPQLQQHHQIMQHRYNNHQTTCQIIISAAGIVIGVVAALVIGLAILAFFLVKRKRRLDASAELVDKARAAKIRREQDLASANEDGIEVDTALSYDYRLIDGKQVVTFLVRLKEILEDPKVN